MNLSEAEIQLLTSLAKAETEGTARDNESLQASGARFWLYQEDLNPAFASLREKGLIAGDDNGFRLTEAGRPLGQDYHRQRPDHYWYYYQTFYVAARASAAHSELCRRAFGADLCQEGQVDMQSLEESLGILDLKPGEHLLDIGCGAGVIAEYISDQTGATVTGLDSSAPAIAEAVARSSDKRARLTFRQGDLNALDLPAESLDAVVSLDTLYWAADLEKTLTDLTKALRPSGRMGLFMNHHIAEGEDPARLEHEWSDLSKALSNLGLSFGTHDYTRQIGEFWKRVWQAATDLQADFEAEGNGIIAESLIRESVEGYLPDIEAGRVARYLWHVRL